MRDLGTVLRQHSSCACLSTPGL